jgi:hypothetical protein
MSEIVAVISDECADDMDDMVKRLKDAGVDVSNVNRSEGVVEGLVDASKVKEIDDMRGVDYVRTVFTYAANFPKEDQRQRVGS